MEILRRPAHERRVRVVLSALIVLLVAGLLWSLLAERDAGVADEPLEGSGAESDDGEGAVPTLEARGKDEPRLGPPKQPSKGEGDVVPASRAPVPARDPVTVTVLDYEGRPLPGALVMLRPRGAGFASQPTDVLGRATFPGINPAKPCDLQIQPTFPWTSRSLHDPDWMPCNTTIELKRGLKITGRVVDEDGEPAPDFGISFSGGWSEKGYDARVEKDGSFEIVGLPPGKVRLTAVYSAFKRPYRTRNTPISGGPIRVDAGSRDVVVPVIRGGVIHAKIENVLVDERIGTLSAKLHDLESEDQRVGEVDLDGNVIFLRLRKGGAYRLTIFGIGRSRYVDVSPLHPSRRVQVIQHKPGGRIRGRYQVPSGITLEARSVVAYHATLGGAFGRVLPHSTDFLIEGLPPETEWTVRVEGYAPTGRPGRSTYFAAKAQARTGAELPLTLVEGPPPPR